MIIVGDVHGCHGEMVSLLERCGYRLGNRDDKERFSVVLAGDLVNKGPGNPEVVRTAREEGFLAVRGNHDNFALAAATGVGRFSESSASKDGEGGGGGVKPPPWVEKLSRCVYVLEAAVPCYWFRHASLSPRGMDKLPHVFFGRA